MKITVDTKEEGRVDYDTDAIDDQFKKLTANATVRKVTIIDTLIEALTFSNLGHRTGLVTLLSECNEAILDSETSEVGDNDPVAKEENLHL